MKSDYTFFLLFRSSKVPQLLWLDSTCSPQFSIIDKNKNHSATKWIFLWITLSSGYTHTHPPWEPWGIAFNLWKTHLILMYPFPSACPIVLKEMLQLLLESRLTYTVVPLLFLPAMSSNYLLSTELLYLDLKFLMKATAKSLVNLWVVCMCLRVFPRPT